MYIALELTSLSVEGVLARRLREGMSKFLNIYGWRAKRDRVDGGRVEGGRVKGGGVEGRGRGFVEE